MKQSTHWKNLNALIIGALGIFTTMIASTLSDGEFVCISKKNMLAAGIALTGLSRLVGELLGNKDKVSDKDK